MLSDIRLAWIKSLVDKFRILQKGFREVPPGHGNAEAGKGSQVDGGRRTVRSWAFDALRALWLAGARLNAACRGEQKGEQNSSICAIPPDSDAL